MSPKVQNGPRKSSFLFSHTKMLYNKFNFIVSRKLLDNGHGCETLYSYYSLPDPRLYCKWKKLAFLLEKNQLCDALVKRVSMWSNLARRNSEKSLVNSGVNEKPEWMKIIQRNIPQYEEYKKYMMNCAVKFITSSKYTAKFLICKNSHRIIHNISIQWFFISNWKTRMYSSRMHTEHSLPYLGGLPVSLDRAPPGQRPPLDTDPLDTDIPYIETPLDRKWHRTERPPLPPSPHRGQTKASEDITLPQILFAGGNNHFKSILAYTYKHTNSVLPWNNRMHLKLQIDQLEIM